MAHPFARIRKFGHKKEPKRPENRKVLVDKGAGKWYDDIPYCDTMPFCGHGSQHEHFITGWGVCQVGTYSNLTTAPSVSSKQHTIRKKGCDDPYGNGQGPNVWQDHA